MRIDYKRLFLSRANSGQQKEIKQTKKENNQNQKWECVCEREKQAEKKSVFQNVSASV